MARRGTNSEYLPSPPSTRIPRPGSGRQGSLVSPVQQQVAAATEGAFRWEEVVRIQGNTGVDGIDLDDELADIAGGTMNGVPFQMFILGDGSTTRWTERGIECSISSEDGVTLVFNLSQAFLYDIGDRIRIRFELGGLPAREDASAAFELFLGREANTITLVQLDTDGEVTRRLTALGETDLTFSTTPEYDTTMGIEGSHPLWTPSFAPSGTTVQEYEDLTPTRVLLIEPDTAYTPGQPVTDFFASDYIVSLTLGSVVGAGYTTTITSIIMERLEAID